MLPLLRATAMTPSSSRAKPTCCPSVDTPRSKPKVPIAIDQPRPGSPTTRSAAVRAPSKYTSLNSEVPVNWVIGRTVMASCFIGTSRYDSPA